MQVLWGEFLCEEKPLAGWEQPGWTLGIVESQRGLGWKEPLKAIESNLSATGRDRSNSIRTFPKSLFPDLWCCKGFLLPLQPPPLLIWGFVFYFLLIP